MACGRCCIGSLNSWLPELFSSSEGEKDVETVYALGLEWKDHKIAASCNFDGAGKWRDEDSPFFAGKLVGSSGTTMTLAASTLRWSQNRLLNMRRRSRYVEFPGLPEHGDVSDWLKDHTGKSS